VIDLTTARTLGLFSIEPHHCKFGVLPHSVRRRSSVRSHSRWPRRSLRAAKSASRFRCASIFGEVSPLALGRLGRGIRKLIQAVLDLVDAGEGARFVLVAARCATDRDAADGVFANLDRHAALPGGELAIEHAGIERTRR